MSEPVLWCPECKVVIDLYSTRPHSGRDCDKNPIDLVAVYEAAIEVSELVPRTRRNDYDAAWKALDKALEAEQPANPYIAKAAEKFMERKKELES